MKTIMHSDYWVEIPEGNVMLGLSDEQRLTLWLRMRDDAGYPTASPEIQQRMDTVIEKLVAGKTPAREESNLFGYSGFMPIFSNVRPQEIVWLKRFYIAKFPITQYQYGLFERGTPALELPGTLEEDETREIRLPNGELSRYYLRCAAAVQYRPALELCRQIGGRLPTANEWEKAARGTNGRLYPWGNEWDESRGFFYYHQHREKRCAGGKPPVDAYPNGVSPYGVWAMAGGLPELVTVPPKEIFGIWEYNGEEISILDKGFHPKESDALGAPYHHLLARPGLGDWLTLRPVLDHWPQTVW